MTHSRVQPLLLAAALLIALWLAYWQSQRTAATVAARDLAERGLHASEVLLQAAKRDAATADQRKAEVAKGIEARLARGVAVQSRLTSARQQSGSALVRQQTTESLRGRPEIMAAAREAALRRIRWQYGPLIARLGLNAAQAAQFEALLVQREGITINNYQLQPVDPDQKNATDEALRQLLRDSGYARFTEYTNSLPVREDVAQLAASLSQVDPLSPAVAEKLVRAGAAAVRRKQEEAKQAGITAYGVWADELMLPAARSLLTPQQFETFRLVVERETGRKVGGS